MLAACCAPVNSCGITTPPPTASTKPTYESAIRQVGTKLAGTTRRLRSAAGAGRLGCDAGIARRGKRRTTRLHGGGSGRNWINRLDRRLLGWPEPGDSLARSCRLAVVPSFDGSAQRERSIIHDRTYSADPGRNFDSNRWSTEQGRDRCRRGRRIDPLPWFRTIARCRPLAIIVRRKGGHRYGGDQSYPRPSRSPRCFNGPCTCASALLACASSEAHPSTGRTPYSRLAGYRISALRHQAA